MGRVDPETEEQIKQDMAEMDGEEGEAGGTDDSKPKKSKVASEPCICTGLSQDGTPGTGLIDAHTICPDCGGTGKVATLKKK